MASNQVHMITMRARWPLCLLLLCFWLCASVDDEEVRRTLRGGGKGGKGVKDLSPGERAALPLEGQVAAKAKRLERLLKAVDTQFPSFLRPDKCCQQTHNNGEAIFAAAIGNNYDFQSFKTFIGSARKSGYDGDIVIAVSPDTVQSNKRIADFLKKNSVIAYSVETTCTGQSHEEKCVFKGHEGATEHFSINMIRWHLYQWWTQKYDEHTSIMVSDFRDVFFQSNPFNYHPKEWGVQSRYQLTVFLEAYPNKMIYRCPFNGGWVESCYGTEGMDRVGKNMVSCSGITFGTRNAMTMYTYLMTAQLDPKVRYGAKNIEGKDQTKLNKKCTSLGMDQGFHNYLLHSGQLEKFVDVKIYPQGEGPVNTVGSFFPGVNAKIKMPLEKWGVLQGSKDGKNMRIVNWNGELSPVVHQLDRFHGTDVPRKPYYDVFQALQDK